MRKKVLAVAVAFAMLLAVVTPSVYAYGMKEATSSLLLPTTGQAMNGQVGTTKSKIMAGVEVAGITTLAILGGVVGGGVTWAAIGPLLANHVWSSVDAYKGAQVKVNPLVQQQMLDAQRNLDLSRQGRFDRDQAQFSDIRSRIMMAGEAVR